MYQPSGTPRARAPQPWPANQSGRTAALFAGTLVVLGAVAAFFMLQPQAPDEAVVGPPADHAAAVPVFIYLIDTLRADHLQVYGYAKPTSPRMNELAAEGVVFEQAHAAGPWTLPSVTSLVTSTFVCEHGIVAPELKISPSLRTLAERMKAAGYATGAYYGNMLAGPTSGVDRGYDVSEWLNEDDIREDEARAFLDRIGNATPFLYLHTMEPHQAYLADYKYINMFGHVPIEEKVRIDDYWTSMVQLKRVGPTARDPTSRGDATAEITRVLAGLDGMRASFELLYDASVREADDHLGQAVDVLKARKLWDKSLFIVVADHGEEFGEHGTWFHEESMYNPIAHVPMIMHFPGGQFAGRRVAEPVSLVDVAPTVLDFIGRPDACDGCRGTSLLGLVRGEDARDRETVMPGMRQNLTTYHRPVKQRRGDVNVVVRKGQWKGIWNDELQTLELYDLSTDPGELSDLSAKDPAVAKDLQTSATGWLRDCRTSLETPEETPLDERTRERLRSLGYAK